MRFKRTLVLILAFIMMFSTICLAGKNDKEIEIGVFKAGGEKEVEAAVKEWFAENYVLISSQEVKVSFKNINKARILKGDLKDFDVLLIAANSNGDEIATELGAEGAEAIKKFVSSGGGYLGIGGGAYLAAQKDSVTNNFELINLKFDPVTNHGEGQLVVKPNAGTIITDGMEVGKNYIAYAANPPVLIAGDSTDPNMGTVINAVKYVSNPTNNLEPGQTGINMAGTPAVAAAEYGSGRVVISGIQPQIEYQPAEMNYLLGRMLLYAAGIDGIEVASRSPMKNPDIVAEWLWSSTVYNLGPDGAEKIINAYHEMGVTDIYLLVKGTNGTVYYLKEDPVDPSRAPKGYTDRDILQEVIEAAHQKGIKVHAWVTSSSDKEYKLAHKEEGRYHFTRGRDDSSVTNYNISFLSKNFIDYSRKVAMEIARNYEVDGIHFDYIRYNHACNGWGPEDRTMLTKAKGGTGLDKGYGLTQEEYNELVIDLAKTFGYSIAKNEEGYYEYSQDTTADGYLSFKADDKTLFKAYADKKPGAVAFVQMRCDLVRNYAEEVIEAARSVNRKLEISAALMPEGAYQGDYNVSGSNSNTFALVHYGQSYIDAAKLYDYICPMLYTGDYGGSSQWLASLVKNAESMGNKVVAGLQAYNPTTSFKLKQDIDAVRKILSNNVEGFAFFRTGMFNHIKTIVNKKDSTLTVKLINARDADYPIGYARINLLQGLTADEIISLEGGLSGATAVISDDGKSVVLTDFNLPYGYNEGTITIKYSGKYDSKYEATYTLSAADSEAPDVRSYQITQ